MNGFCGCEFEVGIQRCLKCGRVFTGEELVQGLPELSKSPTEAVERFGGDPVGVSVELSSGKRVVLVSASEVVGRVVELFKGSVVSASEVPVLSFPFGEEYSFDS